MPHRRMLWWTFVVQVTIGVGFLILAFVVAAFGEPRDPSLTDFRLSDLDRRLREIEGTRPHNITRLGILEKAVETHASRIGKLENAAIYFLAGGGVTIGGSGVLTWRTYQRVGNAR